MPPPDCAEYAVIPDFTVAPDYTELPKVMPPDFSTLDPRALMYQATHAATHEPNVSLEATLMSFMNETKAFMNETKAYMNETKAFMEDTKAKFLNNGVAWKNMEDQVGQLATTLSVNKPSKIKETCKAISVRSGKEYEGPSMGNVVTRALGEDQTEASVVITLVPETRHPASAEASPKVTSSETLKKTSPDMSPVSSDKSHVASATDTIMNNFFQERPPPPFPQRIKKANDALKHPKKGMEYCYFMKTFDTLAHQQIFLNRGVLEKESTHLDVKVLKKEKMFDKELKQLPLLKCAYLGSESTFPMINYAQITSSKERIIVELLKRLLMEMLKNHTKEETIYWAYAKETHTWNGLMVNRFYKYFDHDVGNVDTKFHGEKLIIGVKSLVQEAYHQMSTTGKEQLFAALGVQIQLIENWILRPRPEPPPLDKSQKRGVMPPVPREKRCKQSQLRGQEKAPCLTPNVVPVIPLLVCLFE
ncbi:hypothetical protein QL285_034122 [Trifolium repens]|nr:hypothetical protein QL285_034122 [Trifolium repens]